MKANIPFYVISSIISFLFLYLIMSVKIDINQFIEQMYAPNFDYLSTKIFYFILFIYYFMQGLFSLSYSWDYNTSFVNFIKYRSCTSKSLKKYSIKKIMKYIILISIFNVLVILLLNIFLFRQINISVLTIINIISMIILLNINQYINLYYIKIDPITFHIISVLIISVLVGKSTNTVAIPVYIVIIFGLILFRRLKND